MELKLNSWYSKWYSLVYLTSNKPKDLCTFFWKLIVSSFVWVLSNPLWIFAFIWRKWQKKDVDGILYIIPIIFNITFLVILEEPYWYFEFIKRWTHLFFMAILACVVIFVFVGIIYSIEKIKERKTFKSKNIVGQRVRDFKNKTCTLIKWK